MVAKKEFSLRKWCMDNVFPVATITSVLVVALLGFFVWVQIKRFETGLLDVCATQQDAYVQLVLDQINIKENRKDDEIIKEILSSLDASSNKYWTFSKNEAMVFVKDVLETNKYQGFTTATYYISDSAKHFLDGLKLNKVTHSTIMIGEKSYIASGVVFEYAGDEYRLCLLTNRSVFLDNNRFLGAKINLAVLFAVISFVFLISTMELARKIAGMVDVADAQGDTIAYLNESVNQLNDKLSEKDMYDTRHNILGEHMLPEFLERLQKRHVDQMMFVRLACKDEEAKNAFFEKAQIIMDHSVVRFKLQGDKFLLLFIKTESARVLEILKSMDMAGIVFDAVKAYTPGVDLLDFYDEFKKR